MNNILAAKVLMSHLPEITDGAYKTAIEIAIENLIEEARTDWFKHYQGEMSFKSYLGLSEENYKYWIIGVRE